MHDIVGFFLQKLQVDINDKLKWVDLKKIVFFSTYKHIF